MRAVLVIAALGACTFDRPADVKFGDAAITITEGDHQTDVVARRLPTALKVNVTDGDFKPIENFTVEFTVRDDNGTVSERAVRTDAQGNARTELTLGTVWGEQFVDVSGEGIEGNEPVFFTAMALADAPAKISPYAGDGATATVATQLAAPLVARVEDQYGNPSPVGVPVSFAVVSGGGTLATPTGTSATDGTVSTAYTLSTTSGPVVVDATAPGLDKGTFHLVGAADVAVSMERTSPQALLATALRPSDEMIVTARDMYGNPAPGATINFERTAGTGTLTAATVVTGADGRAVNTFVAPSLLATATITVTGALTGSGFTFTSTTRSFRAAQAIPGIVGKVSRSIAVGDLNADGLPDIVAATVIVTPTAFSGFTVYMNTTTPGAATATFSTGTQVAVPNVSSSSAFIGIFDANADGKPDVLINPNSTTVFHPNTTTAGATMPTFGPSEQINTISGRPVMVDLNGDQMLDLMVVGSNTTNAYRRTAATFTFAQQVNIGSCEDEDAAFVGDINGDGKPDVGTFDFVYLYSYINGSANVGALSFTGTTFQQNTVYTGTMTDLDADGKPDWVIGQGSTVFVYLNTTTTTPAFTALANPPTGFTRPVVFDMNGDGLLDIIGPTNSAQLRVSLNTGTATAPTFAVGESLSVSIGGRSLQADVNKDGKTDFVVDSGGTGITVVLAQ